MNHSHKYLFITLFFVPVDQLIFFVLITHEIALDTRLYVIVFLFLLPVILYITLLVENAKQYDQYV